MPYDLEEGDTRAPVMDFPPMRVDDLEAIVTLLELGALMLTQEPGETFTAAELMREAQDIAGPDLVLDERDVQSVLEHIGFLVRCPGGRYRLR